MRVCECINNLRSWISNSIPWHRKKIGRGRGPQQPLLLIMICFFVCFTQLPGPKVHQSTYQQSRVFGACTGASAKLGASASCSFSSSKLYGSKEGLQLVFLNWVCPTFQYSILMKKIYIYIYPGGWHPEVILTTTLIRRFNPFRWIDTMCGQTLSLPKVSPSPPTCSGSSARPVPVCEYASV